MERLNWHMLHELSKYADVRVIGPCGAGQWVPEGVIVQGVPLKPLWRFLSSATVATLLECRRFRPDAVLAGSGLMAPMALLASKVSGASPVAYVHGLDLTVTHPVYKKIWLPAIRRMHRVIANSRATYALARSVGINDSKVGVVPPGVELPGALSDAQAIEQFRNKHGLGSRTILLSVGRLSKRKGLQEFVANALPLIVQRRPDVLLLVVGDVPRNALHAQSQTPASIQLTADQAGAGNHLRFLGNINDAELQIAFDASTVHVFPIRQIANDPEGFGMVAVEAASHGVPTVAFAVGGVVDAVAEGKSGYLVAPDNYQAMADSVVVALTEKQSMAGSCREFACQFAWSVFGERVFEELVAATKTTDQVARNVE